jgi:hypothetical protein
VVYQVVPSSDAPHSAYVVRGIDDERDGKIYLARFEGCEAKQRAEEYAKWKNAR